jgi:hypothetical protein
MFRFECTSCGEWNEGMPRPFIELEPTDHPLALEQKNGITVDRVAEIYAYCVHQQP